MFDSPILEVVIGLFFVYLLLSLLATALNELFMTYVNARGKGLLMGIQKLLDDSNARHRLSHFIFHSPQFKKLYRPGSKRIPSYLSGNQFVEIFLYTIHERRITDVLIAEALESFEAFCGYEDRMNALSKDVRDIIDQLKVQLNALDAIGENDTTWQMKAKSLLIDWFKGLFRTADAETIATQREKILANIETLYLQLLDKRGELESEEDHAHWKNVDDVLDILKRGKERLNEVETHPITFEDVSEAVRVLPDGETKALLSSILREADRSLSSFKFNLERWFHAVMDRASAWYKRKVQIALLIIGLGVSVAFNADSFRIVKTLSADPEARMQLVQMATAYIESKQVDAPAGNESQGNVNPDTTVQAVTTDRDAERIAIIQRQIDGLVDEQIQEVGDLLGLGWENWDVEYRSYQIEESALNILREQEVAAEVISSLQAIPDLSTFKYAAFRAELNDVLNPSQRQAYENLILEAAKTDISLFEEIGNRISYGWPRLWGWIVTSIAISLGAPFWFDLLKKIINLRGTGKRPETPAAVAAAGPVG